jgi:hypothetical protein
MAWMSWMKTVAEYTPLCVRFEFSRSDRIADRSSGRDPVWHDFRSIAKTPGQDYNDIMSQTPDPMNAGNIARASRIGLAVAAGGVILFLVVWFVLEPLGVDHVPRIVIAVCLPPALIALVAGGYVLLIPSRHQDGE